VHAAAGIKIQKKSERVREKYMKEKRLKFVLAEKS